MRPTALRPQRGWSKGFEAKAGAASGGRLNAKLDALAEGSHS